MKQAGHVTTSHTIQRLMEKRIDAWKDRIYGMLVEKTLHTCAQ